MSGVIFFGRRGRLRPPSHICRRTVQLGLMVTTSKLFCPKCGRETQEEGLCQACFAEKYVVFELPQVLEVKICSKCPSYKIGDAWVDTNLDTYEELARKATAKTVRLALAVSKDVHSP